MGLLPSCVGDFVFGHVVLCLCALCPLNLLFGNHHAKHKGPVSLNFRVLIVCAFLVGH